MAIFVSICTQKGGVGKSTLTAHFATYYAMEAARDVLVIDADFPQHTLVEIREIELSRLDYDEEKKQRFLDYDRIPYAIESMPVNQVPDRLDELSKTDKLVFIDLPGTLNVEGYGEVVARLDVAILLLETDPASFASTMTTAVGFSQIKSRRHKAGLPLYLLWNKWNSRERASRSQSLQDAANTWAAQNGVALKFFSERVPLLVAFKDHRSTLVPYKDLPTRLIEEMNKVLGLKEPAKK